MTRDKESGAFPSAKVAAINGVRKSEQSPNDRATPEVDLEAVVSQLNAICKTATLKFALDVGRTVVDRFYAGDLEVWRRRDQSKDTSLRKLARHPHLPMSPSALYRSIAIYELFERLDISAWKHISTAHIRLVLPLKADHQALLLSTAEAERWSVRYLDAQVEAAIESDPAIRLNRGGGARLGTLRKFMRPLEKFVAAVRGSVQSDAPVPVEAGLSPERTREALRLLQDVVDACELIRSRLSHTPHGLADRSPCHDSDLDRAS